MSFPENLQFGSVCSGIEAASVAFAPLGWEAAWLAEVDVAASQVLSYRLGATAPVFPLDGTEKAIARHEWGDRLTNWGDMTRVADMVRAGKAAAPDILCGGTPCQAFSVAGRRGGLADARGQLTLSFVDLADAIDERRADRGDEPCIVIWENVPGVLSSKDNAFGCFLAALAGEDVPLEPTGKRWTDAGVVLGPERTVAWRVGDAQYFGLAQRRRRVFVVASAREGFDPAAILFEFEGLRRDSPPSREAGEAVAGTLDARTDGGGFPGSDGAAAYHVVPHGRRLGGTAGLAGYRMTAFGEYADDDSASTLKARDYKDATDLVVHDALPFDTTQVTDPRNGSNPQWGDPCHPLARTAHPPTVCVHGTQDPDITVDFAHTLGRNSGQENAVCVTGGVTHTLRAEGFDASENGTGRGQPITLAFAQNTRSEIRLIGGDGQIAGALSADSGMNQTTFLASMAVRRLMPVECHRLQGFPDDWCAVPIGPKGKIASDGAQYRQLGNSWAVNHAHWVARRIDTWMRTEPTQPILDFVFDDTLLVWALAD